MIKYVFNPFTGKLDAVDVAGPGDLREIEAAFGHAFSGAIDFGTLAPGDSVIGVQLVIDEAFDDPAALISLGLVSNPDGILSTANVDPGVVSTYGAQENVLVTGADAFRLKVFPFASTQGAGRVVAVVG
jgi:hypothetical protein